MQTPDKDCYSAPAQSILELVQELTIGQRSTDTIEQLAFFLHSTISPKLGPFSFEIYYLNHDSQNYHPAKLTDASKMSAENVPSSIPADHPAIVKIRQTGAPLEIYGLAPDTAFLAHTQNVTHLLAPILDGANLLGLLYFGCLEPCTFTSFFLGTIATLAAIIGSRLKSMGTILQLKQSMRDLEYSERLRTALYEISELAHQAQNITNLYANLHQIVARLIPAKNFYIALIKQKKDAQYISFPYYVDSLDAHYQGQELPLDQENQPLATYLLKTRQPLLLTPENFQATCREQNIKYIGTKPHSWLGAPFYLDDLEGLVAVQSYDEIIYNEKDMELIAFVARHLGDALKRKGAVDDLQKAKDRAEQAEKKKSTFLANMSHEIRTPMNGIIGLTELVLKSEISHQQRTYLEMVHSSADRLLKLINDILDFSKIEAGKFELNVTPFSLRSAIADALEILSVIAAKKNIALLVDCDRKIPDLLMGDADKLQQILVNLVGNAIKFTNQGSVTIVLSSIDKLPEQNEHITIHFQIKDTGIGIPQEKLSSVFDAFNQIGTTRDSNHPGTGLGLVISAELVEMMGGKICVESNPGVGTTFFFSVHFPLAQLTKENQPATGGNASSTPNTKSLTKMPLHILLVEDELINRTLAVSVLEREGWVVEVAENGMQALHLLTNTAFDLILMDIQMPELNGYETTRAIRNKEHGTKQHIPIIAMTAYAVRGDREKCLAAGMDGYISKPVRPDRLREEIETVLRLHTHPQSFS
jgi:signal transduction histidine kinase/ActR/RegA family two-component response regulator